MVHGEAATKLQQSPSYLGLYRSIHLNSFAECRWCFHLRLYTRAFVFVVLQNARKVLSDMCGYSAVNEIPLFL
jgi:hypothetical protein